MSKDSNDDDDGSEDNGGGDVDQHSITHQHSAAHTSSPLSYHLYHINSHVLSLISTQQRLSFHHHHLYQINSHILSLIRTQQRLYLCCDIRRASKACILSTPLADLREA